MDTNKEKAKLIDIQIVVTTMFIFALIISISLAYDKKQNLLKEEGIYTNKEAQMVALFQSIIVVLGAIEFLYVVYKQYSISKEQKDDDENDLFIQTGVAFFSVVTALIGLFIIIKNINKSLNISEIETI